MRKDTLGGLIAGAYIVIVGRLAGSDAGAIHSHSPHVHIGSMNTATENEDYCVWVLDDSIDQSTAYSRVTDSLFNAGDPSRDWDGIRWVEFVGENDGCLPPATHEIMFMVKHDVANTCANP